MVAIGHDSKGVAAAVLLGDGSWHAGVRAVAALLRWLQHHPTPAPEPIYRLVTLKRAPVRRFEHCLRLPRSPFPSISLVSDRLPADLPNDIEPLPDSALRSLPAAARRGLVLVDRRLRIPNNSKGGKGRGRVVPVDFADPEWAESAREAARCVELRVEARGGEEEAAAAAAERSGGAGEEAAEKSEGRRRTGSVGEAGSGGGGGREGGGGGVGEEEATGEGAAEEATGEEAEGRRRRWGEAGGGEIQGRGAHGFRRRVGRAVREEGGALQIH